MWTPQKFGGDRRYREQYFPVEIELVANAPVP
jgi:hypothetical protein